jgi:hypothetical protein
MEILPNADNFKNWSPVQVGEWLNENGFKEYSEFFIQHQITGDLLLDLDYPELLDIGVIAVGDRARIINAITKQFRPKMPQLKTSSLPSLNTAGEEKGKNMKEISVGGSPKSVRRGPNNISATSGALKSQAREMFQSKSPARPIDSPRDVYQRSPRNLRCSPGTPTKPLMIFPRSSSMKEKANAPHQQFSEALESVFGPGRDDFISPHQSKDARDKLLREVQSI